MNKNQLTEYADYLLKTALYKVQNIVDAEDLVQETLMAALVAIEQKKPIENPKNWLITVLNRKYYDKIRQKYRKQTVSIDVVVEIPQDSMVLEQIEKSEDAENIRRCLAHLTTLYREVMVRFYMHSQSVKQIAKALDIPENTVKSRLDTGRKHIRKDFTMETFTKQSYEPEELFVSISGQDGLNGEPFSLVRNDRIPMNLLILAYEKPVTIPELAKAIGISTTYIEPIVNRLVDGQLMKRVSDRVYTDFIIFNEQDRTANLELEKELAQKNYKGIWRIVQQGLSEIHEQDYYKSQSPTQQLKLDSFFAVRTVAHAVYEIRNEVAGKLNFEDYTDRPNGGKWHAMGNRYPSDYDWKTADLYHKYYIDGEASFSINDYCGLKEISLCGYDTKLGKSYQGWSNRQYIKHPMEGNDVAKMLYAIYTDKDELLPIIYQLP